MSVCHSVHTVLLYSEDDLISNRMRIKYILPLIVLLYAYSTSAQQDSTMFCVAFKTGRATVDSAFGDNGRRLAEIRAFIRRLQQDHTLQLQQVRFSGNTSPEGTPRINRELSKRRVAAVRNIVCSEMALPDSVIVCNEYSHSWDDLRLMMAGSAVEGKDTVVGILEQLADTARGVRNDKKEKIRMLRALNGGKTWRQLDSMYFAGMRNSCVQFVTTSRGDATPVRMRPAGACTDTTLTVAERSCNTAVVKLQPSVMLSKAAAYSRRLYIKSNMANWLLGISNAAIEVDLFPHWSCTLPVAYSAWNYFSSEIKFRTLSLYPELRYWLSPENDGWYVGAHYGMAWYNFCIGRAYRTQDKGGHSPAMGGGLAVGYRLPLDRGNRWKLELSLGAGVYRLHHDKFLNKPNGAWVRTERTTYMGPDQVAITFAYTLDLNKRAK